MDAIVHKPRTSTYELEDVIRRMNHENKTLKDEIQYHTSEAQYFKDKCHELKDQVKTLRAEKEVIREEFATCERQIVELEEALRRVSRY